MSSAPYPKLDDWLQDVSEVARQPLETVIRYRDQLIPLYARRFTPLAARVRLNEILATPTSPGYGVAKGRT